MIDMGFVRIEGTAVRTEAVKNVVATYDKNWRLLRTHNDDRMATVMYIRVAYTFHDMAGNPGRGSINEEFLRQYTAQATHADIKFRRGQPTRKTARTFWDDPMADPEIAKAFDELDDIDKAYGRWARR